MKTRRSDLYRSSLELLESRIAPATFTVTNLADAGPGSLRQAVISANASGADDTVVFAAGLSGTITLTATNPILITDDVVIKGHSGIKLSGNDASQIFYINDGGASEIDVTISKLTFIRANGDGPGAFNDGGAIFSTENLTVKQSKFRDNHIPGGLDWGGAISLENSDAVLKVTNTTFQENSSASLGGAIYSNAALTHIASCIFEANAATGNGGAIELSSSDRVLIKSSTFSLNTTSTGVGGAILFNACENAVIRNTLIEGNTTTGAAKNGGGVSVISSFLSVTDSTIRDNEATGDGGGIHSDTASNLVIDHSLFVGNRASVYGGGVTFMGNLSVMDSRFKNNSAHVSGGAIRGDNTGTGDFFITNSIIGRNTSDDNGGGLNIFNSGSQVIDSCSIINNTSSATGGGLRAANGDLTVIDTLISGNSAVNAGGASVLHTTRFVNCLVTENTASTSVGGILNGAGTAALLQNTPVEDNTAPASPDLLGPFSQV